MSDSQQRRPDPNPLPGTWPASSFGTEYLQPHNVQGQEIGSVSQLTSQSSTQECTQEYIESNVFTQTSREQRAYFGSSAGHAREFSLQEPAEGDRAQEPPSSGAINPAALRSGAADELAHTSSSEQTVAPSLGVEEAESFTRQKSNATSTDTSSESGEELEPAEDEDAVFEPIRTGASQTKRPSIALGGSRRLTEDEIFGALSRRNTGRGSRPQSYVSTTRASSIGDEEDQEEIERLMSRMFGKNRQAQSEDEKTRHVGVIFKNLTVKGMGLGAALQPSVADPFMGPFRLIKGLFSNPRNAIGKPPVRNLLNNFTGCIRPGEMLLVLGRPG